jgi:hypothetical protein
MSNGRERERESNQNNMFTNQYYIVAKCHIQIQIIQFRSVANPEISKRGSGTPERGAPPKQQKIQVFVV